MKNALNYYYNLYPTSIHKINNRYKCYVNNDEYILIPYKDDIKIIDKIFNLSNYLLKFNMLCHQIIQNINGQILTLINNENYVLLKINIKNRTINLHDILVFSSVGVDKKMFNELAKDNWYQMWTRKIDYFEYQVSQIGIKYPVIRESINYYIGLAENSISLLSNLTFYGEQIYVISHKRIKNSEGVIELYNPLNFIVDTKARDLAEYIKEKFFFSNYNIDEALHDIFKFNFNRNEYNLLLIRLLFPSYYFDCYEEILSGNKTERDLVKIIYKNDQYISFLKQIYVQLKQISNIMNIEWIIKT